MDIMGTFIGVSPFPDSPHGGSPDIPRILPFAAVACRARRGQYPSALPTLLRFYDADHVRGKPPFVDQAADAQAGLQAQRNVAHHVGELPSGTTGWRRARRPNWWRFKAILARGGKAELRCPHRAPRNAPPVTRAVEAAERTFQPFDIGQQRRMPARAPRPS